MGCALLKVSEPRGSSAALERSVRPEWARFPRRGTGCSRPIVLKNSAQPQLACFEGVPAETGLSHRADLGLRHLFSPQRPTGMGSETRTCGSRGRQHVSQKWLSSASAPTLEPTVEAQNQETLVDSD